MFRHWRNREAGATCRVCSSANSTCGPHKACVRYHRAMNWHQEKLRAYPAFHTTDIISDLALLYPPFAQKIEELVAAARNHGLPVFVYETYRSQERQRELYAKKATMLEQNSMHHFGIAADIAFEGRSAVSQTPEHEWLALGALGKKLDLYWGGDWTDFKDYPHFQMIPATREEQQKIVTGQYPL